jgi:hypothetical protein
MNILLNLNEVLALCLRELGSLADDDVLFLSSLTIMLTVQNHAQVHRKPTV